MENYVSADVRIQTSLFGANEIHKDPMRRNWQRRETLRFRTQHGVPLLRGSEIGGSKKHEMAARKANFLKTNLLWIRPAGD